MKPAPSTVALLLLPFSLLAVVFFVVYPNDLRLQTLTTTCLRSTTTLSSSSSSISSANFTGFLTPQPDFRLLIGILTIPDRYERRHLLRMLYSIQTVPSYAHIDIKFVFCNFTKEEHTTLIALEIMKYDDIIILNCPENMNRGKTYTYFTSLPTIFNATDRPPYDYVMKADDDIYFRLPRMAETFRSQPKEDFYWGFVIPCESMDVWHWFMYGAGYAVSWDLVEWMSTAEIPRNHKEGKEHHGEEGEDMILGSWLREGNKAKNRFNAKPAFYDYPIHPPINQCSHEFVPDTIAVHRLKDALKWSRTLQYFNVTAGLKPSNLYDLSQFVWVEK